jgi:hypothetical protein
MKRLFILLPVFSASLLANAQNNNFLLYNMKGNVSVIENKVEIKAKIGKVLDNNSILKVAAGSLATLICNEQSMFTINKAGTYTLSQFKDSCQVHNSSFTSNYLKYVWAQMTSSHGSPGSNRKAYMNTVGAVSRSVNNIWIDPRLDTVNYVSGEFPLSWKSYADASEFDFYLYANEKDKKAEFNSTVKKLKIPITSFSKILKPDQTYYWTAAVKGEQNDELKVLNTVSKEKFDYIVNQFKAMGPAHESPAEQAYRVAFMLEDAHFLSEAYQYYLKAATTEPSNMLYRSTLMSFKKDYEIK